MEQLVEEVTQESLSGLVVSAIVSMAASFAREFSDFENSKWFAYERAKDALSGCELTPDEYQRAIKLLTEALKI